MSERLKWLLPPLVLVAGVLGAAVIVASGPQVEVVPPETPVPLVRVVEASRGDTVLRVRTHGTVVPRTESDLVPEVSARVVWVSPSLVAGGFFAADEPLLRLERTDLEVVLEEARALLARAESEADRAARELARQETLAERQVASPARLDDASNAARVSAATARAARASLTRAERDLARAEIRAPFTGRVREKAVDVGQFVSRGVPVARLYAVDYAEIRLPVADEQLAYIEQPLLAGPVALSEDGPEVRLTASFAGREHVWMGRIVRTEGELDPRSRMVHVVARVEAPYDLVAHGTSAPLAVGLFVEAEIRGRVVRDAVALPRAALRPDGRVLVVDEEDRLRFREVVVVRADRETVLVERGIEAGERVLVSHLATVADGMRVRPMRDETAAEEGPS